MGRVRTGHRIAHRELDEPSGGARAGVAEEVIGEDDEGTRLVVAHFEDGGEAEAFDERELVDLGPASSSDGMVLLRPRHLLSLWRSRPAMLGVILLLVSTAAFSICARILEWSLITTCAIAAGMLFGGLVTFSLLQREIERGRSAQPAGRR